MAFTPTTAAEAELEAKMTALMAALTSNHNATGSDAWVGKPAQQPPAGLHFAPFTVRTKGTDGKEEDSDEEFEVTVVTSSNKPVAPKVTAAAPPPSQEDDLTALMAKYCAAASEYRKAVPPPQRSVVDASADMSMDDLLAQVDELADDLEALKAKQTPM